MSKNIVFLTSAVYTNYGYIQPEERIKQTLDTNPGAKKVYRVNAVILWWITVKRHATITAMNPTN
jgi:hypothetical protein